jgi:hypothetical protein
MANLVTIEDSTVLTMLRDSRYTQVIPCLFNKAETFRTSNMHCGACARKRQERQRTEMAKIKSCLAALSAEKKRELKQLMNAEKIRVTYVNASGQVVQLTF